MEDGIGISIRHFYAIIKLLFFSIQVTVCEDVTLFQEIKTLYSQRLLSCLWRCICQELDCWTSTSLVLVNYKFINVSLWVHKYGYVVPMYLHEHYSYSGIMVDYNSHKRALIDIVGISQKKSI